MDYEGHAEEYQSHYQHEQTILDIQKQPFTDFMQSILYGQGQELSASDLSAAPGAGLLDFYDDASLDMNEVDFGMLDNWKLGNIHEMIATDPNLAACISQQPEDSTELSHMRKRLVSIWSESPWRWMPDGMKDNTNADKSDLSLGDINGANLRPDRVVNDKLEGSGRDRIMINVLETCQNNAILSRVASCFPSTEILDSLAHVFLAWHLCQVSEFVHFPSFSLNKQPPQWLGVVAAAGAILTPVASLRKFGYALQEAFRKSLLRPNCVKAQIANPLYRYHNAYGSMWPMMYPTGSTTSL